MGIMTKLFVIDSGESLLKYLKEYGMNIAGASGITGSENIIYLPDRTTLNWKSKKGIVRVNCKQHAKSVIEAYTDMEMFENGVGDPTRGYSIILEDEATINSILDALKKIEGNGKM